jgi:zinc finger-containing ubiquitin peptidase 1
METRHPEGESPFVLKEDNAPENIEAAEDVSYVECPVDSCGEVLLVQELDYHLELHSEESGDHLQDPGPDTKAETPPSGPSRTHREAERHRRSDHEPERSDRQTKAISAWKRLLKMPGSSTHRTLLSKRSHDDKTSGHSSRGKRLGVSNRGLHRSSMVQLG